MFGDNYREDRFLISCACESFKLESRCALEQQLISLSYPPAEFLVIYSLIVQEALLEQTEFQCDRKTADQ